MNDRFDRLCKAYSRCLVTEAADEESFWASRPKIDDPEMLAYAEKYGKSRWISSYVYDKFDWEGKEACSPEYLDFLFFRQDIKMIEKYDPDGQFEGLVYNGGFETWISEELANYLYWSGDASLEEEVVEGSMFMDKECVEALVKWMVDMLQNDWQSCDPMGFTEDIWQ